MASVTYNFVYPEEYNNFVPEVVKEQRSKKAQEILLIVTVGIIVSGIGYLYYQWWQDQKETETQIKRQ